MFAVLLQVGCSDAFIFDDETTLPLTLVTVNATVSGSGRVYAPAPQVALDCPGRCNVEFPDFGGGGAFDVVAEAADGWILDAWGGDCATAAGTRCTLAFVAPPVTFDVRASFRQVTQEESLIAVDLFLPLPGLTVSRDTITVQASVEDMFGDVEFVEVILGSSPPDTVFRKAAGATQRTYELSHLVTLVPGENRIRVRATNTAGNIAEDEVTVSYVPVAAGTVRWDGETGDGLWFTPGNWDGDAVPGPADSVVIPSAGAPSVLFTLFGSTSVRSLDNQGTLTIRGGTLGVSGNAEITGALVLDPAGALPGLPRPRLAPQGEIALSGSLRCTQGDLVGGTLRVAETGDGRFESCVGYDTRVENSGRLDLTQGDLGLSGASVLANLAPGILALDGAGVACADVACGSTIENRGRMEFVDAGFAQPFIGPFLTNLGTVDASATSVSFGPGRNDGVITSSGGAVLWFTEAWTMTSSSSLSATSVQVPALGTVTIAGSLDVTSLGVAGTVQLLPGASASLLSSVDISTDGRLDVATGAGDPDVEISDLHLTGGTLRVATERSVYVRRNLRWLAGTLTGGGRTLVTKANILQPEATLTLQAGLGARRLDGHDLLVVGTTTWQSGDVEAGNGAVFTTRTSSAGFGSGIFQAQGDHAFDGDALGGTPARFVNDGIVRKTSGTGTTTIEACYQQEPGASLEELSGTLSIVQLCPP